VYREAEEEVERRGEDEAISYAEEAGDEADYESQYEG